MVKKSEKNRVKHLHESTIKMFLFASAMDNESVPTELTESCKRIINSKTVALAEQELNLQFESRGLDMVSFPTGYTSNASPVVCFDPGTPPTSWLIGSGR